MSLPHPAPKLSANKISLIIISASVILSLVIGLVIAGGQAGDSHTTSASSSTVEYAEDTQNAAPQNDQKHIPTPFASVYLVYEKTRQGTLEPALANLNLARDWAIYTGTSLKLDSPKKSQAEIIGQLETVGDIGDLQFWELTNYSFNTPKGKKIPGMYADKKHGLDIGQGWRIPLTTAQNHQGDLIVNIHYSSYRTNLILKVRQADGTLITSSPLPYPKKGICSIRTTLQNLQPDTPYYLELVVESYYTDSKNTRTNGPHGLGINAVVVE